MTELPTPKPLREIDRIAGGRFEGEVKQHYEPVVLRGQVADWPAVAAGRAGPEALAHYVARFADGQPVEVMIGAPSIGGRFFYRDDMRGFNFHREQVPVAMLLNELLRLADTADPPALYAGAAAADAHLPGWREDNASDLPLGEATARVWIGNATRIATHFDESPNLACVVAGSRRFLLFPPDQIANLYIGPIDATMAGQPASMVDPDNVDLARHPRFAEAMAHARVAVLEPGDAIFIPALWWHNVRATGPFNVLVNYWWDTAAPASPLAALAHALLAIRELPSGERATLRHWFDHYVFDDAAMHAVEHLPPQSRGVLGEASPARIERLKSFLRNSLSSR